MITIDCGKLPHKIAIPFSLTICFIFTYFAQISHAVRLRSRLEVTVLPADLFPLQNFSQFLLFMGGIDQGGSQLFDQLQAWLTFISKASFLVVLGDFGCDVTCQAGNWYSANWPGYEAGILGGRLREVRLYERTLSGCLAVRA